MLGSRCVLPHCRGPNGTIDFENCFTLNAWQTAWCQLQSYVQLDGLGALLPNGRHTLPRSIQTEIFVERARVKLPLLVASTRGLEIAPSLVAAIPLIGAGPGLTPSWDDLLIGYICGLRATTTKSWSQVCFLSQFGEAVHSASAVTTAVSRSYINSTIEGCGPDWVEDVLAAMGIGDSELTYRMAVRALRMGNTSGTDMMLGAVLGSCVWQASTQIVNVLAALSCRKVHPVKTRQTS